MVRTPKRSAPFQNGNHFCYSALVLRSPKRWCPSRDVSNILDSVRRSWLVGQPPAQFRCVSTETPRFADGGSPQPNQDPCFSQQHMGVAGGG
jgi:hypothetical protein